MSLDQIVSVTIDKNTLFPTRKGFGIPLLVSQTTAIDPDNVRSYNTIDEVEADFASSTDEYKWANAMFNQNPRPEVVKIGKKLANVAESITITPTAVNNFEYEVTVRGTKVTFTSDADATVAEITAGLVALIDALDDVSATDNTTDFTVDADTAGLSLDLVVGTNLAAVVDTANVGIESALSAILDEDPDFYALYTVSRVFVDQQAIAQWVEPRDRIAGLAEDDSNIKSAASSTDILSVLAAKNYDRTFFLFRNNATNLGEFAEGAWGGKNLPKDPGSITWAFKNLNGITADALTATEKQAVQNKKGNVYTKVAGVDITQDGIMVSGEYIDIIRGTDWIKARIQEEVYAALINADKIPFTNQGVDQIKAEILKILQQAVFNGILAADPVPAVTAPDVADVSTGDKANRLLPDVKFTGTYAGAVHKVTIEGELIL